MKSISDAFREVRYFLTRSIFRTSNNEEIILKEPTRFITEGLSAHEFKLRRLVYMEFLKEHSVAQAVENVNSKLDVKSITIARVSVLFKRFSSGDLSFFDKGTRLYTLSCQSPGSDNGISRALHSTLLFDNDPHFYDNLTVIDGRIAVIFIAKKHFNQKLEVMIVDLFNGNKRMLKIAPNLSKFLKTHKTVANIIPSKVLAIDAENILVFFDFGRHVRKSVYLKIDYQKETIEAVSTTSMNDHAYFLFDKWNFAAFARHGAINNTKSFTLGHFKNDEFVEDYTNSINVEPKLKVFTETLQGNVLYSLCKREKRYNKVYKELVKVDLLTGEQERIRLPPITTTYSYGYNELINRITTSVWSTNHLYALCSLDIKMRAFGVFIYSMEENSWTETEIRFKGDFNFKMFVDENDVLTIHTTNHRSKEHSFYRFSMRHPDSLLNLAWLTVLNTTRFLGTDLLSRLKLPKNCPLNSRVVLK